MTEKWNDPALYGEDYFEMFNNKDYFAKAIRLLSYCAVIVHMEVKTVLDVGCGPNFLCDYLNKLGVDATGVDFSTASGADVIASATDMPFEDQSYDLVFSSDLLEHLNEGDIDKSISEFSRIGKHQAHNFCCVENDAPGNDPWHITKESRQWWFQRFEQHGLYPTHEFGMTHNPSPNPTMPLGQRTMGYMILFNWLPGKNWLGEDDWVTP
jgi:SAM-dependent methyltransferase